MRYGKIYITFLRFLADAAKPLQEQDGLTFGTSFTKRRPPATTTTSSQRFATILRWTTLEKTRRTENSEPRQRGFFSYMLFTQTPLLRPDLPLSRQTAQEYLQGGSAVML